MRFKYNVYTTVSRKEYLREHPNFIDNILEASIKNAGAINLLNRKHDPQFITGFNYLYPQLATDLTIYHGLNPDDKVKVLESRPYTGRWVLKKKKDHYLVRVFRGSVRKLAVWVEKLAQRPGSEYRRFKGRLFFLRQSPQSAARMDAKRKYRGPDAKRDYKSTRSLRPLPMPRILERKLLVQRGILRALSDSREHPLSSVGPKVQKMVRESRGAILLECGTLSKIGAIAFTTPEIARITQQGMETLKQINWRLVEYWDKTKRKI